ncbi:hypothetical protein HY408_02275 [Candidatus Gottesmanbacteria bacterium]|nr:hypothetical protein [Candidatus Gottesmanbacteria bacterium]
MLWIEQFFGVSLPTREASAEPVKYFEPTHDDEEDEGELDDEVSSEQDDSEDTDEDNESDSQNVNFVCPQTEWIDCMPGPDKSMDYMGMYCSQDYLKWAQENCPGFEGAAY